MIIMFEKKKKKLRKLDKFHIYDKIFRQKEGRHYG